MRCTKAYKRASLRSLTPSSTSCFASSCLMLFAEGVWCFSLPFALAVREVVLISRRELERVERLVSVPICFRRLRTLLLLTSDVWRYLCVYLVVFVCLWIFLSYGVAEWSVQANIQLMSPDFFSPDSKSRFPVPMPSPYFKFQFQVTRSSSDSKSQSQVPIYTPVFVARFITPIRPDFFRFMAPTQFFFRFIDPFSWPDLWLRFKSLFFTNYNSDSSTDFSDFKARFCMGPISRPNLYPQFMTVISNPDLWLQFQGPINIPDLLLQFQSPIYGSDFKV